MDSDTELLIEAALTAWRPRTPPGEILPHPAWADLPPTAREQLFEETLRARRAEQALVSRVRSSSSISLALDVAGCVGPPPNTQGIPSSARLASATDRSPE